MRRGELLERTLASTRQPDEAAAAETASRLDAKTKPPGSLGRLEELAVRLAAIRGGVPVRPPTKDGPLRSGSRAASFRGDVREESIWSEPNRPGSD